MILFDIVDLADAYRKAKADLFYSGNPCRIALSEFEDMLSENLQKIQDALNNKDIKYLLSISEGYWLCPKRIVFFEKNDDLIASDPNIKYSLDKVKTVDLRIIEHLPIAFHVITTLWINKIGIKFDQVLSNSAYGNRIRHYKDEIRNLNSVGTFRKYFYYYRSWRDNGLKKMRISLEKKKNVIAITADFTAFYHNIDASFITSSEFQEKLGIKLNKEEKDFTALVVLMLRHWATKTPIKKGLPVGCSISAVIANIALALFDRRIERDIVPLYYGRYVDDIILVLNNSKGFKEQNEVWDWIKERVPSLERKRGKKEEYIVYDLDSDLNIVTKKGKNKLFFEKSKTKVFFLDSPSGLAFLDTLERQIKERSSEWRSLPELPEDKYIASTLLSVYNKNGEEADNLRKSDSLSTKRASFSIKLSIFESYNRNLPQITWKKQRESFLSTIDSYFTNINSFFELFPFFPRIISIATECGDYDQVISIAKRVYENCQGLSISKYSIAQKRIKSNKMAIFDLFLKYVRYSFCESVISSISFFSSIDFISFLNHFPWLGEFGDSERIKHTHRKLFGYDLATNPFRQIAFYDELSLSIDQKGSWIPFFCLNEPDYIRDCNYNILLSFAKDCIKGFPVTGIPYAWLFPTRPFNMLELYLCIKDSFYKNELISNLLYVLRGYPRRIELMPKEYKDEIEKEERVFFEIQNDHIVSNINVALISWETNESNLLNSVRQKGISDINSYQRLTHLRNPIIASPIKIDYVVFPELAIPSRLFLGLSYKLSKSGISLIGGVEYLHREDGNVCNQVWCSLLHKGLHFPQSVVIKQDKVLPAIHEESILKECGVTLIPENDDNKCAIIRHGDFYFGVLICSELTNINYRALFRGYVDAVFVPAWNKDTEMFGSLIEAAAYDIHAYIIQCNTRQYGDTRIRIPSKDHYKRDVVKIKGGEEDFFVIGNLDIKALRQFQSKHNTFIDEKALFKPVPVGFQIASYRECSSKSPDKQA